MIDGPPAELISLFVGQIVPISLVQHTVGKDRSGSDRENVAFQTTSVAVDIIQARALTEKSNNLLKIVTN